MEISWLGHSCIRLRARGKPLLMDPYAESVGLSMGRPTAGIVTVSNPHPHHAFVEGVAGDPVVIDGPGEYEIGDFYVFGAGTPHSAASDEEQRINTVFLLRAEEMTVCHLGDLARPPSPQLIQQVGQADVLFVPAGGVCTITPSQAAELVGQISPRIVIPIHYSTGELTAVELGPLDAFLSEMGLIEVTRETTVNITPSSLPRDLTLVVLDRSS